MATFGSLQGGAVGRQPNLSERVCELSSLNATSLMVRPVAQRGFPAVRGHRCFESYSLNESPVKSCKFAHYASVHRVALSQIKVNNLLSY